MSRRESRCGFYSPVTSAIYTFPATGRSCLSSELRDSPVPGIPNPQNDLQVPFKHWRINPGSPFGVVELPRRSGTAPERIGRLRALLGIVPIREPYVTDYQ